MSPPQDPSKNGPTTTIQWHKACDEGTTGGVGNVKHAPKLGGLHIILALTPVPVQLRDGSLVAGSFPCNMVWGPVEIMSFKQVVAETPCPNKIAKNAP